MIAASTAFAIAGGVQAGASLLSGIKGMMGARDEQDALEAEAIRRQSLSGIQTKLIYLDRDMNLNLAEQSTTIQKARIRREAMQARGRARASFGASGVDISAGGSPLAVLEESAKNEALDSQMASYNLAVTRLTTNRQADMDAMTIRLGVQSDLTSLSERASQAGQAATSSLLSGGIKATTAALGAYTSYKDYQQRIDS